MFCMFCTSWSSATACCVMTWRLLNASSWRVRPAARSAAFTISSASAAPLVSRREVLHEHLGVAVDGHQQVVEVVRDAAGEPADRFHLLRLAQLLLALASVSCDCLRSITSRTTAVNAVPSAAVQRGEGELARKAAAVLANAGHFDDVAEGEVVGVRIGQRRLVRGAVGLRQSASSIGRPSTSASV